MSVRLLYASHSATHVTAEIVESILGQSRKPTRSSASPAFSARAATPFMQVLEGGRTAVNLLYNDIVRDERHKNVVILHYEEVASASSPAGRWAGELAK